MNIEKARTLAENLVASSNNQDFVLKYVEAKKNQFALGEWIVLFDVYTSNDALLDGPIVIIVNELTGIAQYMESP